MNKRIRYVLSSDNVYMSTKVIETAHGEVLVSFNLENKVVQIIRANDLALLDTFVSTTNHKIKIDIKKKLLSMGAVFESETRNTEKENVQT